MNTLTMAVLLVVCVSGALLCYNAWVGLPRRMREVYKQSLAAFARAIEERSNGRFGDTNRVAMIAMAVGSELDLKTRDYRNLELAAYLRDIGLSAVPHRVINNVAPRNEAEQATFDRHAETGAAMLEQVAYLRELAPIVRHHHALWGEFGEYAPMPARILSAVSSYCEWEYESGRDEALEAVRQCSGTLFDPKVVHALTQVIERLDEPNYWETLRRSAAVIG